MFQNQRIAYSGLLLKNKSEARNSAFLFYFKNLEEPSVSIKNWQFPGAKVFDFLKLFENHCYVYIKTGCFDILRTAMIPSGYLSGRWYPPNASCKAHGVEVPFCFPAKGKRATPVGRCSWHNDAHDIWHRIKAIKQSPHEFSWAV